MDPQPGLRIPVGTLQPVQPLWGTPGYHIRIVVTPGTFNSY